MEKFINDFKLFIPHNIGIIDFVQIALIFVVFYYLVDKFKRTRAWILVKGICFLGAFYLFFYLTGMVVIQYIIQSLFSVALIAVVIMFQPELQRFVEKVGTNSFPTFASLFRKNIVEEKYYSESTIKEIVQACDMMAEVKTGALIVLEREIPLDEFIESGISIKAEVTNQLLINTFEKNTPLHDGAVIIRINRLESATCYLPLSKNKSVKKSLGTRHRAAIGLSETTDAIVIVVSEETGKISVSYNGKLKEDLNRSSLYDLLMKQSSMTEQKINQIKEKNSLSIWLKTLILIGSVLLWAVIININDPIETKTFYNVPVQILNEDALTNLEKVYEITKGSNVDVEIKANKSMIDFIEISDLLATADFKEMSIVYAVPINIELNKDINASTEIISSKVMTLSLEERIQGEFPITIEYTGKLNDSLYLNKSTPLNNSIVVYGSKTSINKIGKAVATVNLSTIEDSKTVYSSIVLFDKNGEQIKNNQITTNIAETEVEVSVYKTKEITPIIKLSDNKKYKLENYSCDTVLVAANDLILNSMDYLEIELNPEDIDITKNEILINLELYLPDDVYLATNQDDSLSIQLSIGLR